MFIVTATRINDYGKVASVPHMVIAYTNERRAEEFAAMRNKTAKQEGVWYSVRHIPLGD